jgi:hypothetical protein
MTASPLRSEGLLARRFAAEGLSSWNIVPDNAAAEL